MQTHPIIIAARVVAVVVTIATVTVLWNLMLWLPWQIDCAIAATAACGFAYRFERGDGDEVVRRAEPDPELRRTHAG